ncbi:MAG: hypothetical protein C0600_03205 [Ignavibacteria bacterium]|nr:MAG: hypothetical protein C0600_03205 [Ignavibacteria bacterium]
MAGGGGLISLPSLLAVGVPPHVALATNKVQSAIGTSFSTLRYIRSGHVLLKLGIVGFISAFAGSYTGAWTVLQIPDSSLEAIIPVLIIIVAAVTFLRKDFGIKDNVNSLSTRQLAIAALFAFGIGFYDGFFGPGTGSFLAFGFVLMFGFGFLRATAHAKLLNLGSNYAAIIAFVLGGEVYWTIALPMGLANITGAWTGAGLAIKGGAKVIKPVFGFVLAGLLIKLIFFP